MRYIRYLYHTTSTAAAATVIAALAANAVKAGDFALPAKCSFHVKAAVALDAATTAFTTTTGSPAIASTAVAATATLTVNPAEEVSNAATTAEISRRRAESLREWGLEEIGARRRTAVG